MGDSQQTAQVYDGVRVAVIDSESMSCSFLLDRKHLKSKGRRAVARILPKRCGVFAVWEGERSAARTGMRTQAVPNL